MDAPKDGHYVGTTAQGEPLSFDVVEGGAFLTCLTFKVDSGAPSEIGLTDEPITITGAFPIGTGGPFGDTVIGDGIRATIAGTISPVGTASGTLSVELSLARNGTDIVRSSGDVRWTARAA